MQRISKTWTHPDFIAICRVADDMHRASQSPERAAEGLAATGAIVALLDRYASPCDCMELATGFGCRADSKSLAYAIRDEADERGQPPSIVVVDLLKLTVL